MAKGAEAGSISLMNETENKRVQVVKQVIVVRRDLNMRLGKAIAQGAHASMMFMIRDISTGRSTFDNVLFEEWLQNGMSKICVRANSEEHLVEIFDQARTANLRVEIVRDAGRTEFRAPTLTALAIGPDDGTKIDAVTGRLQLL
jgi:peptidyl-tRNA hydrolase, PTH2 family